MRWALVSLDGSLVLTLCSKNGIKEGENHPGEEEKTSLFSNAIAQR